MIFNKWDKFLFKFHFSNYLYKNIKLRKSQWQPKKKKRKKIGYEMT